MYVRDEQISSKIHKDTKFDAKFDAAETKCQRFRNQK